MCAGVHRGLRDTAAHIQSRHTRVREHKHTRGAISPGVPGTGRGQRVPPAPAPAAAPPRDPPLAPGPPFVPGPNSSQMGRGRRGGCISKAPAAANAAVPPPGPRPPTPPDPRTALPPWGGGGLPVPCPATGTPTGSGSVQSCGFGERGQAELSGRGIPIPPWGRTVAWGRVPAAHRAGVSVPGEGGGAATGMGRLERVRGVPSASRWCLAWGTRSVAVAPGAAAGPRRRRGHEDSIRAGRGGLGSEMARLGVDSPAPAQDERAPD